MYWDSFELTVMEDLSILDQKILCCNADSTYQDQGLYEAFLSGILSLPAVLCTHGILVSNIMRGYLWQALWESLVAPEQGAATQAAA